MSSLIVLDVRDFWKLIFLWPSTHHDVILSDPLERNYIARMWTFGGGQAADRFYIYQTLHAFREKAKSQKLKKHYLKPGPRFLKQIINHQTNPNLATFLTNWNAYAIGRHQMFFQNCCNSFGFSRMDLTKTGCWALLENAQSWFFWIVFKKVSHCSKAKETEF